MKFKGEVNGRTLKTESIHYSVYLYQSLLFRRVIESELSVLIKKKVLRTFCFTMK